MMISEFPSEVLSTQKQFLTFGKVHACKAHVHNFTLTCMGAVDIYQLRPLLFTVAYKMTKSVFTSEDIVHDVLLNFEERKPEGIADVQKYLVKSVIYQCLDVLRRDANRSYIGINLPEPLTDPLLLSDIRHDISFGVIILLQQLNPLERACFVLKECFDYEYAELAEILDRSEENCRQLLHRAKEKMKEKKLRQHAAHNAGFFARLFLEASHSGNLSELISYMKNDIVVYADGGGKVKTALNPIISREFVVSYFANLYRKWEGAFTCHEIKCNGQDAIVLIEKDSGAVNSLIVMEGEETISSIYLIRNPDKLIAVKLN
jgi:RNA polymerase sigma-70 factor, ECF subfamily